MTKESSCNMHRHKCNWSPLVRLQCENFDNIVEIVFPFNATNTIYLYDNCNNSWCQIFKRKFSLSSPPDLPKLALRPPPLSYISYFAPLSFDLWFVSARISKSVPKDGFWARRQGRHVSEDGSEPVVRDGTSLTTCPSRSLGTGNLNISYILLHAFFWLIVNCN